jgi:hypothetical protein
MYLNLEETTRKYLIPRESLLRKEKGHTRYSMTPLYKHFNSTLAKNNANLIQLNFPIFKQSINTLKTRMSGNEYMLIKAHHRIFSFLFFEEGHVQLQQVSTV